MLTNLAHIVSSDSNHGGTNTNSFSHGYSKRTISFPICNLNHLDIDAYSCHSIIFEIPNQDESSVWYYQETKVNFIRQRMNIISFANNQGIRNDAVTTKSHVTNRKGESDGGEFVTSEEDLKAKASEASDEILDMPRLVISMLEGNRRRGNFS